MKAIKIPVIREGEATRLPLPGYETEGSSGMDLRSCEDISIAPGQCTTVGTGLKMAIPHGYEGQVRPRSGLALKKNIIIPNSPGTIDSDYRGELRVIMMNLGKLPFEISRGDRIAQLVIVPVVHAEWLSSETLDDTSRGEGGFGSTGI